MSYQSFGLRREQGLLSYSSPGFWSAVRWATQTVGLQTWNQGMLYRALAGWGFVLAGMGLYGLFKRLEINATISRPSRSEWLEVALGVLNVAGAATFLPLYESVPLSYALLLRDIARNNAALRQNLDAMFV